MWIEAQPEEEGGYWPEPVHGGAGKSDPPRWFWLPGGPKSPPICWLEKSRGYEEDVAEAEEDPTEGEEEEEAGVWEA